MEIITKMCGCGRDNILPGDTVCNLCDLEASSYMKQRSNKFCAGSGCV